MKNTKTTFKVFVDIEKELEYIRSMNAAGWKLTAVCFGCAYSFERCLEGEYTTLFVGDDSQNESLQKKRLEENGYQVIPYKYDLKPAHLYITRKSELGEDAYYNAPEQKQFFLEAIVSRYKRIQRLYIPLTVVWVLLLLATLPAIYFVIAYEIKSLISRLAFIIILETFGVVWICSIHEKLGKYKKKYKRQLLELKDRIREKQ